MRFSIARLLIATVLVNLVLCLSYAVPAWIGFPALTFLSLIIIPPMIIVGVVNTRGARQAFFLGCMLSGIAHWVISMYMAVMFGVSAFDSSGMSDIFEADEFGILRGMHAIGYLIGIMGGLSGVGMYFFVRTDTPKPAETKPSADVTETTPIAETAEPSENGQWQVEEEPATEEPTVSRPATPK